MRIGFIGAGKVGTNLGRYFRSKDFPIVGYYSRNYENAVAASRQTNSRAFTDLKECIEACDWLFITVPDDQIAAVWSEAEAFVSAEQFIFHCSGAKSSLVFATDKDVSCFSFHPLAAFANKELPLTQLADTAFTLEGTKNVEQVEQALVRLGNPIAVIASEEKVLYHAACVFASNLVVGLSATAEELFVASGLPNEFAKKAWRQLFSQNIQNLLVMSPSDALTGPVERNDLSTVSDHLAALPPESVEIYRELTKKLLQIAAEKHPERDYRPMERKLDQ